MRSLLFFDLPVKTSSQRKAYRKFVKKIKANGFYMIQKSVYAKMSIDPQAADSAINSLKDDVPQEGFISVITITEKQFSSMRFLIGEYKTDVVQSDERLIEL